MFGCGSKGSARSGFRVSIECPRSGDFPDIEVILDPVSGEAMLFQKIEEAVLAAQERLAELESKGRLCHAHITYYASILYPVLIIWGSDGRYELPNMPCIKKQLRGG